MTVHYSTNSADKTYFAVTADSSGWLSLAFPETPGRMVPSGAVIYTPNINPQVQVYSLSGKSAAGVTASNTFAIDDIETIDNGFIFSRAADNSFDPTADTNLLLARHPSNAAISYHGSSTRGGLQLKLGGY